MPITSEDIASALRGEYGITPEGVELIRHNESMTYRVLAPEGAYVLRVHLPVEGFSLDKLRPGENPRAALVREAELLECLYEGGIEVQRPIRTLGGAFICDAFDAPVTLCTWIDGVTLDKTARTGSVGMGLGRTAARMHAILRGFDSAHARGGYRYTQQALPILGKRISDALGAGAVSAAQAKALQAALDAMRRGMNRADEKYGDTQTVHSDMSPTNLLVTDRGIAVIDFSLNGESHIHMDIAALLAQINEREARKGILRGYKEEAGVEIDLRDVEPYFALQIMLFIACQYERFAGEEWFPSAIDRWIKQTFAPLAEGAPFLTL